MATYQFDFEGLSSQFLYEDNHIIILNKKPGQIIQGDKTNDLCLCDALKAYIKQRDSKPGNVFCGVVHRLDRPVSGVVIFAKTSKALERLNAMLQQHTIHKTYWAITKNTPTLPEMDLEHYLTRNEKENKAYAVKANHPNAKKALLHYKLLAQSQGGYNLLEVDLKTGRHHQIRCQLSAIGCPIKGDLKYGAERSNRNGSISLHAREISFEHPVSHKEIHVIAPVPQEPIWTDFENTINTSRQSHNTDNNN